MTVHKLDLYPTQSQTDLNPLPIRKNSQCKTGAVITNNEDQNQKSRRICWTHKSLLYKILFILKVYSIK